MCSASSAALRVIHGFGFGIVHCHFLRLPSCVGRMLPKLMINVLAKTEEEIRRSFKVLRWQNRLASVMVGAFAASFASMVAGLPVYLLFYVSVLGSVAGLILESRHWKRYLGRLARSSLKLNDECLEVQGVVNGGFAHCRFRLKDITAFEIGRKRAVAGLHPLLRALDGAALIVGDKGGDVVALEMAGVIFHAEDLARMAEQVSVRSKG